MISDPETARRAERAYLGCVLIGDRDVRLDGLTGAMFLVPLHRAIYAECELMAGKTPIDLVTVGARLSATGKLTEGWAALAAILDSDYCAGNEEAYADVIRAQATMRRREARGGKK